jgi:hypothetical protein
MSETDRRLGEVLSAQPRRLLHALRDDASRDADPILRREETLDPEEYVTLCYELHHVLLPELEDDGLVAFDRFEDEVTRGPKFDEICPSLGRTGDDPEELSP